MAFVYNISLSRSASFVHVRFDDRRRSICSMFTFHFVRMLFPFLDLHLVSLPFHDIPHCFYAGHLNTLLINTSPLTVDCLLSFRLIAFSLSKNMLNIARNLDQYIQKICSTHAFNPLLKMHTITYTLTTK